MRSLPNNWAPHVLLVHCGGNDMAKVQSAELVNAMKEDLQHLNDTFPQMHIIFSKVMQRCQWRGAARPGKINKARKWVNSVMATFVRGFGGSIVAHPHIRFDCPGQFLPDGVHFTTLGNDIFFR